MLGALIPSGDPRMGFIETFYTEFVPIFLFTVMVAMGLSLRPADLGIVLRRPKAIVSGLAAQLMMLPALGIGLGILLQSPAVIAAGAIILVACPGGITSNAYTFASRADTALSIGLTTIASVITVFTIPFFTLLALDMHLDRSGVPAVPIGNMMWTLAKFTIIPVALGMTLRAWRPEWADRAIEPLRAATIVALMIVLVFGSVTAWPTIVANIWTAGLLMTAINLCAMTLGYGLGKLLGLPFAQVAAITFEVGVQNLSLALFVCLTFLESPDLAVASLVYALVMKVTAFSFVWLVRSRLAESELLQTQAEAGPPG